MGEEWYHNINVNFDADYSQQKGIYSAVITGRGMAVEVNDVNFKQLYNEVLRFTAMVGVKEPRYNIEAAANLMKMSKLEKTMLFSDKNSLVHLLEDYGIKTLDKRITSFNNYASKILFEPVLNEQHKI